MTKLQLIVGEKTNAGFGDFFPVSVRRDMKEYGCDVHTGTGSHCETLEAPEDGIIDWEDGRGLIANGLATQEEVMAAVNGRGHEIVIGNDDGHNGVRFWVTSKEIENKVREAYEMDEKSYEKIVNRLCESGDAKYLG